jgi:hypothetical protein
MKHTSGSTGLTEARSDLRRGYYNPAFASAARSRGQIKATKRRFNLRITGKLSALRLGQTFQYGRQMSRIDIFGLAVAFGKLQHGARDFVLDVSRQPRYRFKRPF